MDSLKAIKEFRDCFVLFVPFGHLKFYLRQISSQITLCMLMRQILVSSFLLLKSCAALS